MADAGVLVVGLLLFSVRGYRELCYIADTFLLNRRVEMKMMPMASHLLLPQLFAFAPIYLFVFCLIVGGETEINNSFVPPRRHAPITSLFLS
ncbi:hypothetical protein HDV64DRAFT_165879 [Trichoderma sp. TUCIM 5745]